MATTESAEPPRLTIQPDPARLPQWEKLWERLLRPIEPEQAERDDQEVRDGDRAS